MEFPQIDPVIFEIWGPIALRWYALAYLFGLTAAWWLGVRQSRRAGSLWTEEEVSDFIFYGFLGVVLGGRIGYVIFYHFDFFIEDPLYLFKVFEGGMSFHGGLLGVICSFWYFSYKSGKPFFVIADFVSPLVPIGLGAGRIGNFINAELVGRTTDLESVPWAIHFPQDPPGVFRHPSQLYEFALEGVALFILLYWFSKKPRPRMALAGMFTFGYGTFRFLVEFFREPDAHLREMAEWLTMGQVLSAPMILLGLSLIFMAYRNPIIDVATEKESVEPKGRSKKTSKKSSKKSSKNKK